MCSGKIEIGWSCQIDMIPLVSIVMPVYNAAEYLPMAMASVFSQTCTDWELLVVDDASTDGSWDYLQCISDPRLRIVRNKKNMKQSFTQNRGIDLARGKWIARMDADDLSLPTRLEKQISFLEANPDIDVAGCGTYLTDADLNPRFVRRPPIHHAEICRWASMNFPLTDAAMVGKIEWFKHWRANPRMKLAQDFEILFRAHRNSILGNISEPLYVYRQGGCTAPLSRKVLSVYYKTVALIQNGFQPGLVGSTLLGLASMAPRPFLYSVKSALGIHRGLTNGQGVPLSDVDQHILKASLGDIERTNVPTMKKDFSSNLE